MDGGQVAITGFMLQTVQVVLEGLSDTRWVSVALEPSGPEYEKVDIRWCFPDGTERHEQVKSSIRAISPGHIKNWAAELSRQSTATRKRLVILGMTAVSNTKLDDLVDGIEVQVRSRERSELFDALAYRFGLVCEELGVQLVRRKAQDFVVTVVGTLLTHSAIGRQWSREELFGLIERLARAYESEPERVFMNPHLMSSLVVTMCVLPTGAVDEHWVFAIRNMHIDVIDFETMPDSSLRAIITEQTNCQVRHRTDGWPGVPESKAGGTPPGVVPPRFEAGLELRGTLAPGHLRHAGFIIRRPGLAKPLGAGMALSDPYHSNGVSQPTTIEMVFPAHGSVDGNCDETTTRTAIKWLDGSSPTTDIYAMWRPQEPVSSELEQLDHELAFLLELRAKIYLGVGHWLEQKQRDIAEVTDAISRLCEARKLLLTSGS